MPVVHSIDVHKVENAEFVERVTRALQDGGIEDASITETSARSIVATQHRIDITFVTPDDGIPYHILRVLMDALGDYFYNRYRDYELHIFQGRNGTLALAAQTPRKRSA
jgi:predicted subunit of tRNA(5-methylaminomethyl-2-thiouridylate) methyltransferase